MCTCLSLSYIYSLSGFVKPTGGGHALSLSSRKCQVETLTYEVKCKPHMTAQYSHSSRSLVPIYSATCTKSREPPTYVLFSARRQPFMPTTVVVLHTILQSPFGVAPAMLYTMSSPSPATACAPVIYIYRDGVCIIHHISSRCTTAVPVRFATLEARTFPGKCAKQKKLKHREASHFVSTRFLVSSTKGVDIH